MNCFITDTGETKHIELIDHITLNDCAIDVIGNNGGIGNGGFVFCHDDGMYHVTGAVFAQWRDIIGQYQELEGVLAVLRANSVDGDAVLAEHNVPAMFEFSDMPRQAAHLLKGMYPDILA